MAFGISCEIGGILKHDIYQHLAKALARFFNCKLWRGQRAKLVKVQLSRI